MTRYRARVAAEREALVVDNVEGERDMKKLELLLCAVVMVCVISIAGSAQGENYFSERPIWSSGTSISGGDGIARLIDFDRDGDLDFVTSAPDPKRWVLYRNENGRLSKMPIWESNETTDCDHIDVIDFNGDGWMDLAGTHESHCTLYFNRWGKFAAKPDWETDITANANQIDFGDFDGDGDYDMVMAAGEPINGVALFENTTGGPGWPGKGRDAGAPAKEPTLKLGHDEYSETAIFADFDNDNDGKLDIIAHYPSGKTVVYRNTDGKFDDGTVIYEDAENPWTQRHYLHDLDGNGQPELFAAKGPWESTGTSLQLARQDGSPTMQVRWKSSPETTIHAFDFGDVDGDGDTDVIASDYGDDGYVHLYLSENGVLADQPALSVKTTGPAHEAVLGDVDLDGDLDLAVGGKDQAHIYENRTVATGFFSAANRAKPMLNAEIGFRPSVFSGEGDKEGGKPGSFPPCDFLNPDRARRWLGDYKIDVTYYSKDYEVVKEPKDAGRYGAVVKITAEDGREYTRFRTLYKTPGAMWLSFAGRLDGELTFPESMGVDEQTLHNQRPTVNQYVGSAIERDIQRSHDFAVLLAGLDETDPEQDPVSQLTSAVTRDRQWWLPLKRKLNGNAERFTETIVAPVVVAGLDAPFLREG
ncbi:MAG: FG-GAP repeat domain-containing protein, partial [Planctomycetota bacterium]